MSFVRSLQGMWAPPQSQQSSDQPAQGALGSVMQGAPMGMPAQQPQPFMGSLVAPAPVSANPAQGMGGAIQAAMGQPTQAAAPAQGMGGAIQAAMGQPTQAPAQSKPPPSAPMQPAVQQFRAPRQRFQAMSKGGVVGKPNYRLHSEDEHQYVIHDGEHTFPVAKKSLSKKMHDQIKAMPHYYAGTADALAEDAARAEGDTSPLPDTEAEAGARAEGDLTNAPDYSRRPFGATVDPALGAGISGGPSQPPTPSPTVTGAAGTANQPTMETPGTNPDEGATTYHEKTELEKLMDSEPMPPGMAQLPNAVDEGAARRQKAAQAAQAASVKTEQDANAASLADTQRQLDARDVVFQKNMQENQRHQDDLENQIQTFKIEPNRLWDHADPGAKIAAIFGILAAGIGGQGRGNVALDQINKFVDRDIAAQRDELGKKQNLLTYYMNKGHDIRSAEQMARADLLTASKMQIEMHHAANAGEQAQQAAAILGAQLDQDIAGKRFNAAVIKSGKELDNWKVQHAVWSEKVQLAQQKQTRDVLDAGNRGILPVSAISLLGEKDRSRVINLGNGQVALAPDSAQAAEANKALTEYNGLTAELKKYKEEVAGLSAVDRTFVDREGGGILTPKMAQVMRHREAILLMAPKRGEGLGRYTELERESLQRQLPVPGVFTQERAGKAADDLLAELGRSRKTIYGTYAPGARYTDPSEIVTRESRE